MNRYFFAFGAIVIAMLTLAGCAADGNFPGREYMPDMAHSIANETNVFEYSKWNHWGGADDLHKYSMPRNPVAGTIPRGYSVYAFENTDTSRTLAGQALLENPIALSKSGMERGRQLYLIFCGVCHGDKADGNGVLWNDGNGPYPNAPANLQNDEFLKASEGRYYHAIMFGKGVMGSYKDKLNEEERWLVIHYIRSLQAVEKGIDYYKEIDVKKELLAAAALQLPDTAKTPSEPKAVVLRDVSFETGSSTFSKSSLRQLEELAKALKENNEWRVQIGGHTDNTGNAGANIALSEKRATAVAAYLNSSGISNERIVARGFGDAKPIAPNDLAVGRAANRRTDITILK